MHHESIEFERTKASLKGCKNILEWLASERIARPYGEQIIGEVRLQFFHAEQNGRFPREAAPVEMTNAEIIRRCKPDDVESEEINYVAGYVKWLMLWAFFTMPDSRIRDRAIELALRDCPIRVNERIRAEKAFVPLEHIQGTGLKRMFPQQLGAYSFYFESGYICSSRETCQYSTCALESLLW